MHYHCHVAKKSYNPASKKDKSNKVDCIDWALVQFLINFLQPFNAATKELEGDSYPTIQKVFQCHHMLKNYMKISPSDSSMLQFWKKRGLQCLKEKFLMSDIHLLGLLFHPKFKLLVPLTPEDIHLYSFTCRYTSQCCLCFFHSHK